MKLRPLAPRPVAQTPIVDRLAFLLKWGVDPFCDQVEIVGQIRERLNRGIQRGRCEPAFPRGPRYRLNFRIKLNGGDKPLVQVGALNSKRQKGGIRILVNPSKWKPGDVEQLHRILRTLIGPDYDRLIEEPLINVLDIAVDILHAHLNRMIVTYKYAHHHTIFGKGLNAKGEIETYNFGSVDSDYMTAVYAKDIERAHAAVEQIAKRGFKGEPLKANFIKQYKESLSGPAMTRIEVRGKKMRGKEPWELYDLTNRFKRFDFMDLDVQGSDLSPLMQAALSAMCQQYDVKYALAQFKHTPDARSVHKFLRSRVAKWWKPEPMWKEGCDALRALGLFPDATFVKPMTIEEPRKTVGRKRRS